MENLKIKIEVLTTEAQLENLCKINAITLEGLIEEDVPFFVEWIFSECGCKYLNQNKIKVNIIKGKTMNDIYNLTGNNAYQDDLTIVAIPFTQIDTRDIGKLALKRFDIGARWFDDIVMNNIRREVGK